VIGWTDPEGSRPWLGALLLGYDDPDGRLIYAGRVGTASTTLSSNVCDIAFNRWPCPICY
jgi:ATP-dependent DNA ligase